MRDFLNQLYSLALFLIFIATLIGVVILPATMGVPVEAAAPDVPLCEAINSAGNLTIYRCLPNEGLPYLVNSNGFMMLED